ncbi:hypothetical protein [Paenibacillus crassostreae]|uniref:hypothetical protein n=1 Tax=Paenibacillus crassostreae TaxID=1763538 RepID=UPI0012FF8C87|nr:hypothetical protein [Paenibacillus crassostreae]
MIYNEVVKIGDAHLLPLISELYKLEGYEIKLFSADAGRTLQNFRRFGHKS